MGRKPSAVLLDPQSTLRIHDGLFSAPAGWHSVRTVLLKAAAHAHEGVCLVRRIYPGTAAAQRGIAPNDASLARVGSPHTSGESAFSQVASDKFGLRFSFEK